MTTKKDLEAAKLAQSDAQVLDTMSRWLKEYRYQVATCGNDGGYAMDKAREVARIVLKNTVNYI